ncbi:LPS export ABC transporter permease LptG [Comamonas aquatica]|jgi:lipopolysaccharide export system permease protein|uniref:Lipopolysaccharide export system permease protein lptG n=1 Tax=Comamonas aquatica TaxID=225991 RepID=A0AA35D5W1_9BURK|nr:LPS export ABC transporter permease LptG [Comamonas aquatica]CAB5651217.1 Lipopolysaccharide export system permease protein lptG [Comamonas aquatica]CAB5671044.1 Lipopolysaccharide export system permease protein lptG [Comamonas aquatica]CAC9219566.1 Lipopolysaccharide export system permease protein lptG [Comamonas aquatica]CAC9684269.1 Lipopolysaccharide export system permease protein lptG [Comamonas aquatica]
MKTLRRLIYRDTVSAIGFVALAFLALFFFFDLLDEMGDVGRTVGDTTYTVWHALLAVSLGIPNHLYELLPIAVLIGSIFVMARFAQSSEFTIMRTSGLGPWLALRTMLLLGACFVVLTVAVGDYIAPAAERMALVAKAKYLGKTSTSGSTGAWLKEKNNGNTLAVNVRAVRADGALQGIRVFQFDGQGRMVLQIHADSGQVQSTATAWDLANARIARFRYTLDAQGAETAQVTREQAPSLEWPTSITSEMLVAAVHKPDRMPTLELFQFIQHLKANDQSAQKYEIEFWRKVFYPLSCLVMVVLALPFAYLHFRSGGIAGYVFGGVMAGISFFLLNNVFGYAGNLQNWSPMLTAAAPGLIYSILSLGAFAWLVIRR